MKNRHWLILLTCLVSWAAWASALVNVRGIVVDQSATPVPGALVRALPRPGHEGGIGIVGSRPGPWITTDAAGEFSMDLPPGRYKIEAKDEPNGYPNPVFALCSDASANFPTILAGASGPSDVRIVLGSRGGILSGRVLDRLTKLPIAQAKIKITDAHDLQSYVEVFSDVDGNFRFTVPSKPLTVFVSAKGYSSTPVLAGAELTVSPGEHHSLNIELERRQ